MRTRASAPERHALFWREKGLHARYLALSFFRMRRSSMKQSPDVVQRTQPIMIITFMSIGAGSSPASALQLPQSYTPNGTPICERYSKRHALTVAILASLAAHPGHNWKRKIAPVRAIISFHAQIFHSRPPAQ